MQKLFATKGVFITDQQDGGTLEAGECACEKPV